MNQEQKHGRHDHVSRPASPITKGDESTAGRSKHKPAPAQPAQPALLVSKLLSRRPQGRPSAMDPEASSTPPRASSKSRFGGAVRNV